MLLRDLTRCQYWRGFVQGRRRDSSLRANTERVRLLACRRKRRHVVLHFRSCSCVRYDAGCAWGRSQPSGSAVALGLFGSISACCAQQHLCVALGLSNCRADPQLGRDAVRHGGDHGGRTGVQDVRSWLCVRDCTHSAGLTASVAVKRRWTDHAFLQVPERPLSFTKPCQISVRSALDCYAQKQQQRSYNDESE
jgi:hypothetical protein